NEVSVFKQYTIGTRSSVDFAQLNSPINNSLINATSGISLHWQTNLHNPKVYLGTDNPPTNLVYGEPVEGKEDYYFNSELDLSAAYYWQIIGDNGKSEVAKFNLSSSNGKVQINELLSANASGEIDPLFGKHSDWVEIVNKTAHAIDLSEHYFSDNIKELNQWKFPKHTVLNPGEFYTIWCDGKNVSNHSNFKLNNQEETIYITYNNSIVDSVSYVNQYPNVSFGREEDMDKLVYLSESSFGTENGKGVPNKRLSMPILSIEAGFYNTAKSVSISGEGELYYTVDGSIPTTKSVEYIQPVEISHTTVLKSISVKEGSINSPVASATFFIDEKTALPVISLSTDDKFLNDSEIGLLINTKQKWERAIRFEYFDEWGKQVVNQDIGVKLNGWGIRNFVQKPLSVYARQKYGSNKIDYPYFGENGPQSFSNLIFRNGGNDVKSTMFRDGLMHSLVDDIDVENQGFHPVLMFLNGKYHGIYNIREKVNEPFFASHHDVNVKKIDIVEPVLRGENFIASTGSVNGYISVETYIRTNNIQDSLVYQQVCKMIDVDEYINYQIIEIYYANLDWIGNNIKIWKEQSDSARWRWALFDLDFGFGLFSYSNFDQNLLETASTATGTEWPNPPFSTFLFRNLLKNEIFKTEFAQRFSVFVSTIFTPKNVLSKIEAFKQIYEPEIDRQIKKWGLIPSRQQWYQNIEVLKTFAVNRPQHSIQHVATKFGYNSSLCNLNVSKTEGGKVSVAGYEIPFNVFSTQVFVNVPLRITAVPTEGYQFLEWRGVENIKAKKRSPKTSVNYMYALGVILFGMALSFVTYVVLKNSKRVFASGVFVIILAAGFLIFQNQIVIHSTSKEYQLKVNLSAKNNTIEAVFVKEDS
ncbi:MAG: CotH kinase family protein, partial [Flavobacteriales bacterium]|nr:CotH kinase family protein [Flavobacteriales bacterium]